MQVFRSFLFLPFLLIQVSCSQPTVDGSTEAALDHSLSILYETLPPLDAQKLRANVQEVNEYFQKRIYKGESVAEAQREYLAVFDGKSMDEISEQVDKLRPYGTSSN